jgi:branched-chain amino acid transport system ATP-binding protein
MKRADVLVLDKVYSSYGSGSILHGLSMVVREGQITCLLGRNGMGKSTTLMTVMGAVQLTKGHITFDGETLDGRKPEEIASRGLTLIPEGRWLFGSLSVEENLQFAALTSRRGDTKAIDQVLQLFPDLQGRRRQMARTLSGGLQQMVAIARALVTKPKLVLLDEPSQGLAPLYVRRIGDYIRQARKEGVSFLLVEENWATAMDIADYFYVIRHGKIAFECSAQELAKNKSAIANYLGVSV